MTLYNLVSNNVDRCTRACAATIASSPHSGVSRDIGHLYAGIWRRVEATGAILLLRDDDDDSADLTPNPVARRRSSMEEGLDSERRDLEPRLLWLTEPAVVVRGLAASAASWQQQWWGKSMLRVN